MFDDTGEYIYIEHYRMIIPLISNYYPITIRIKQYIYTLLLSYYFPIIIPWLSHYYPIIITHYYPIIITLLSRYYPC